MHGISPGFSLSTIPTEKKAKLPRKKGKISPEKKAKLLPEKIVPPPPRPFFSGIAQSAQGELNTALSPLFAHIKNAHLIHDDLIIAADSLEEHDECLEEVMKSIFDAGVTLNASKCLFGAKEIKFWGMIVDEHGVQPDP